MNNEWKDIKQYEGLYRVNTSGEVYSVRSNKILKQFYRGSREDNKYLVVDLQIQGKRKTVSVHRLVAEAFIPNPNNLPCVNHKDGNKYNNCVDNLEWCTYSENNFHAVQSGLKQYKYGTKNKNSKLSYDDVVAIKKCLILGDSEFGTRPLATKYGVNHKVIMDIYHNKKYQDVTIPYTYFVCSDIHSAYTPWMEALNKAGFNKNKYSHKIAICGDLFDRMDETVKVFEFVKDMAAQDRLIYVRGNHEDLLFDCVNELKKGYTPGRHHFHNGTVKTICQFCGQNEWIIYDQEWRGKIIEIMEPVLEFIDQNAVNYADIGDYVLVHGWWPAYNIVEDYHTAEDWLWKDARWDNGMAMWENPANRIEGKTVVCGHWHCSWGWSHIDQKYKEFPQPSHKHFQYSFQPWVKDGIVAIDACTAYSGIVNCIVLEG